MYEYIHLTDTCTNSHHTHACASMGMLTYMQTHFQPHQIFLHRLCHASAPSPTSLHPLHMHATVTRTGHCCEGWEVFGCEQRCRQLPEEPLEQVRCIIGMNLVPANEASIEVSLQLLLQPLEKGGPSRSCPQLPHKPLTLSGPLARRG